MCSFNWSTIVRLFLLITSLKIDHFPYFHSHQTIHIGLAAAYKEKDMNSNDKIYEVRYTWSIRKVMKEIYLIVALRHDRCRSPWQAGLK